MVNFPITCMNCNKSGHFTKDCTLSCTAWGGKHSIFFCDSDPPKEPHQNSLTYQDRGPLLTPATGAKAELVGAQTKTSESNLLEFSSNDDPSFDRLALEKRKTTDPTPVQPNTTSKRICIADLLKKEQTEILEKSKAQAVSALTAPRKTPRQPDLPAEIFMDYNN